MHIHMTFRHMEPTDTVKQLVEEKLGKLKKHIQGAADAQVVLALDRYVHSCDVTITAGSQTYKGREESADLYTSIDHVVDKLERQINKTKGRMRAGRGTSTDDLNLTADVPDDLDDGGRS